MAFSKTIWVLVVSRISLELWQVTLGGRSKARRIDAVANSNKGIDIFWTKVKKQVRDEELRILTTDEISYVIRLRMPDSVPILKLREWVLEQVQKFIPEELKPDDWDYMVGDGELAPKDRIVVYAPVENIWANVKYFLMKYKIKVETVEPEAAAVMRNKDAIIGIALKPEKVIEGSDVENLGLEVTAKAMKKEKKIKVVNQTPMMEKKQLPIMPLIIVGAVLVIGFFIYMLWTNVIGPLMFPAMFAKITPAPPVKVADVVATEINQALSSPTPTQSIVERSVTKDVPEYKDKGELIVQILNGSGKPGIAKKAGDILVDLGIVNILMGNAVSYSYTKAYIGFGDKVEKSLQETVLSRFKDEGYSLNIDNKLALTGDTEADIVIIVTN